MMVIMSQSEFTEAISQEESSILQEIISNKEGGGFKDEQEQEAAYLAARASLAGQTRAKFGGQALTESAQSELEAFVAMQEGLMDTVKNFVLRLLGTAREKLKSLVQQGQGAVCSYLKSRVCGSLPWWASGACNLGFGAVCNALYGWIRRLVGL